MSLGIQGWAGDWVSVVSICIMRLFRRTLSPLSLAITKLRGKMGLNESPAIVPQCRKFRPPTPKSKMEKWRVLSIGRLYPWFRRNGQLAVPFYCVQDCSPSQMQTPNGQWQLLHNVHMILCWVTYKKPSMMRVSRDCYIMDTKCFIEKFTMPH